MLKNHTAKSTIAHSMLKMKSEIKEEFEEKLRVKDKQLEVLDERLRKTESALEKLKTENAEKLDQMDFVIAQNVDELRLVKQKTIQNVLVENTCPFTWKIDHFTQKFQEAKKNYAPMDSPPFFCLNGYKGKIEVYLNNYRNTHITVHFYLVQGPFDEILKWPMPFKSFTIKLLINGKEMKTLTMRSEERGGNFGKCYIRPTDKKKETGGHGFYDYFEHKELPNVIQDDTITFTFDIE